MTATLILAALAFLAGLYLGYRAAIVRSGFALRKTGRRRILRARWS